MHRLRVSTGKKIFFLILAALAGCPPWPSPDQADSLSWTGLQWRNDVAAKGQWAASHERAMELREKTPRWRDYGVFRNAHFTDEQRQALKSLLDFTLPLRGSAVTSSTL